MSEKKIDGLLLPAIIESPRGRKDHTMAFTVSTNELEPEKAGFLMALNGKLATVYIKPEVNSIQPDETEIIDSMETEPVGKTPSQRLRAVLFLMWKKNPEGYKDKNLHYEHYMEMIIEKMKTKLE